MLERQGLRVTVDAAERGGPFRDTASSSAAVNGDVARLVRAAVDADRLPLVLAGSCVACQGVLAGFDHARCGAVWIDAHADFNTPESAVSGFFPGMSLAVATGHCYRNYWGEIGDNTPLAEENVVLLGVRDLSPEAERERLERSAVCVVPWHGGEPASDIAAALDQLARRVDEIYLHIDFDGFAPDVAPGVADDPVPGGVSAEQAETIVRGARARFRIRAVTLATFTPERDEDERTLRLALRLIDLLGHCARGASGHGM